MAEEIKEKVVEEVKEKLETILEESKPKIEEAVEVADKAVDKACEKVESLAEKAEDALENLVESRPELAKVVDVVDEVLAGRSCGCMMFGWKISAQKVGKILSKA